MSLKPFKLFQIYHGIFLHYTTEQYDYHKYQGKTSYKEDTFNRRKDKYTFHKLARIFENHDYGYYRYYIAWMFFKTDIWVLPRMLSTDVFQFEISWREYSRNRAYCFNQESKLVNSYDINKLLDQCMKKELHFGTVFILDHFKKILEQPVSAVFFQDLKRKLLKFKPFYWEYEPINEDTFINNIPEIV